jgi:hypothetical protein
VALEARATSFWDVAGAHPGAPELILISFGIYCNEYVKCIIEGSLEVKFSTIWTDEKQRREESERREDQKEKRVRRKKMQMREKVEKSRNTGFFQ